MRPRTRERPSIPTDEEILAYDNVPVAVAAPEPAYTGRYGDSEFLREIEGRDQEDVFHIMDDLMDTLQVANPRVYNGVMRKIRAL